MASIAELLEGFEGGADGVTITAANTNLGTPTGGGTVEFNDADPFEGATSALIATTAQNRALPTDVFASPRTKVWFGFALKITVAPSATTGLANVYGTGGTVLTGNLRLTNARQLNFRDVATSRWTSAALALDTWYEIRVLTDVSADIAKVKIYDAAGALVEESTNLTMSNAAVASLDAYIIGVLSGSTTTTIEIDRMLGDDTDEPATLAGASTPFLYYDDGTNWIDVSDQLWFDNGTDWVQVGIDTP